MQFSFSSCLMLIKADKLIRRGIWGIAGLALAILASVWWIEVRLPPQIPLMYSRPWGEEQLVDRGMLWRLAGGFGGVGIFGVILGSKINRTQKVTTRIIIWTTVLIEGLGLLAVWNVWWRVGV